MWVCVDVFTKKRGRDGQASYRKSNSHYVIAGSDGFMFYQSVIVWALAFGH